MALICGVDEAGRGPWAGPVVAAAAILPDAEAESGLYRDSKKLSPAVRLALYHRLRRRAHVALGWASVAEIDRLNIRRATLLAMRRAVAALPLAPALALVDGCDVPELPCRARAIIGGDAKEPAIAAASIAAKAVRDRWMRLLDARHPGYGFARHKGYGTRAHREALLRLGPSPAHRRSFAPVRAALCAASRKEDAAAS